MWLTEDTLTVTLTRWDKAERDWLMEYLTFRQAKSRFTKGPAEDCLFDWKSNKFPAGLLPNVLKAGREAGFTLELLDHRGPPPTADLTADLGWLRWYQREAVDRVVAKQRGILWLPTGAGKTEIAVGLERRLPGQWLLLVHRSQLADQAAARWELRNPGRVAGRIGEGKWVASWAKHAFIAATFQTLKARLDAGDAPAIQLLSGATRLIVDEAHVLPAESFQRVAMATPNARVRVGLSGTPLAREDKRSLLAVATLGPVIYRLRPQVLIDEGVLARPLIKMVPVVQQIDAPTWQGVYGMGVVRSAARNRAVVAAVKMAGEPCLVFVKEVMHGRLLEKLLLHAGVRAGFVWGTHSNDARHGAVRDLVAGRVQALVCSTIFTEGVDIPELRSVVVASGGKSVIAALQRVGRGMRTSQGKNDFLVYDFLDQSCGCHTAAWRGVRHGGCKWLPQHARDRRNAYTAEGYTVVEENLGQGAGSLLKA